MEELPSVMAKPIHRGTLVAAIERTEEIPAVSSIEDEQAGGFSHQSATKPTRSPLGGCPRPASIGSTTLEAISVFSRSNAARWRSGRGWPCGPARSGSAGWTCPG